MLVNLLLTTVRLKYVCVSRKRGLGGGGGGGKKRRKTQPIVDYGDIAYEMRCVLYNIGAAHARLAAAQDRSPPLGGPSTTVSSDDGESESAATDTALKVACTHLQCAAWAFQVCVCDLGVNMCVL